MTAVDSSIAVAAFGEWHVLNEKARMAIEQDASIPAHCLLETYSVLTGFPPPHRAPPMVVVEWIAMMFPEILAAPPPEDQRKLISALAKSGRIGGSIYDGLVALTVQTAGQGPLVTADARAAEVYDLVGVDWELVG